VSDFVYLYGYVPADAPAPDQLAGIADGMVCLEDNGALRAVISDVPAAEYAPERVEERLQDLKWVAEQGVAHERVVAWFVDHSQILPAPLFTMYSSRAALREATAQRSGQLSGEMERLRGLREWNMKIAFDEGALQQNAAQLSEKVADLDAQIASAPAGKGYLLQKKRADLVKTEIREAAHRRAADVLNAVSGMAVATRSLPIPRTQDALPVVMHAALLVQQEHEQQLARELETQGERLRPLGMELTFSGPWAPYRFMGEHG
jgi:hypothetical protein